MDEDVSIMDVGLGVVGIGDTDNRDTFCEWRSWNRLLPTIKHFCEEDTRSGAKILPTSW
jgi:hypothetical protein